MQIFLKVQICKLDKKYIRGMVWEEEWMEGDPKSSRVRLSLVSLDQDS